MTFVPSRFALTCLLVGALVTGVTGCSTYSSPQQQASATCRALGPSSLLGGLGGAAGGAAIGALAGQGKGAAIGAGVGLLVGLAGGLV